MYYFDPSQYSSNLSLDGIKDACKRRINKHIEEIVSKYGSNLHLGWTTKTTFGYVMSDFIPEITGFRLIGKGAKKFFGLVRGEVDFLLLTERSDHLSYILNVNNLKILVVDILTFKWLLRTFSDQRNTVKLILNKFDEKEAKIVLRWFRNSVRQMNVEEVTEVTQDAGIIGEELIFTSIKKNPSIIRRISEIVESADFDIIQRQEFYLALDHIEHFINNKQTEKISELIKNLRGEDSSSIEELNKHLKVMTLSSITKTISITRSKISALNKFKEMLMKDDTYEVSGHGSTSVHEFLEENPWFMGDKYDLYKSEVKLKDIVKSKLPKKLANRKPDFVLLRKSDNSDAIVLEIKRPSIKLGIDDVLQVFQYKDILKENMPSIKKWTTILVGGTWKTELIRSRDNYNLVIESYLELYADAEAKLTDYLGVYEERQKEISTKKVKSNNPSI